MQELKAKFMTRTTLRKLLSVCVIITVIGTFEFFFGKNGKFELHPTLRILLVLTIVVLFNISSFALRKVFSSRRMIRRGNYVEGAQVARQFVAELKAQPWKRLLCKFAIEVYTSEPEVLGHMCIASAYRHEGNLDAAFSAYLQATQIDPLCPTAFLGLALVSGALGNQSQAEFYVARSRDLGYTGSISDKLFMLGGDLTGKIALSAPVANS